MEIQDVLTAEYKLKTFFLPGVQNTIDKNRHVIYKKIKNNSEGVDVSGEKVQFSIRLQNAQGIGARSSETAILPAAVRSKGIKPSVPLKNIFGTAEISSKLIKAARNPDGAFETGVQDEFDGLMVSYNNDMGRQAIGDGNGKIAQCGVTAASNVVVLDSGAFIHHFDIGMRVDIVVAATGVPVANGESKTITAIDITNKTITVDGTAVTTDATHMVVREDAYGAEISGLDALVGNQTLYGFDPALYPRWQSFVKTGAGELSLEKMGEYVKEVKIQSGHYPDLLVTDDLTQLWVWHLLKKFAEFRFDQPKVNNYDGGYKGLMLTIDGRPMELISDVNVAPGVMYGLTSKHLELKQYAKPDFMRDRGNILINNAPGNSGTATYKVVLEHYCEMIIKQRNSHFKASGFTKPSTY